MRPTLIPRKRRPRNSARSSLAPAAVAELELRAREAIEEEGGDLISAAESRAACEASLAEFIRQAWPVIEPSTEYLHNWHIDLICEHLEAITRGELRRLIINIPPRYMKSTIVTVMWPCWEWLRIPGQRWMFGSYSSGLSTDHSMSRRTIIESPWFQARWGDRVRLIRGDNLKTKFRNTFRGLMLATSVGGSATGLGGNRIVVDDPHNPEQADSDLERAKGIRFYSKTLYSRLNDKKRGAIVVVMQRLNEGDLTGYLLEHEGDAWTHLCLEGRSIGRKVISSPSGKVYRRDDGEPLWPEREGVKELEATERAMTPLVFAGQYQQRPAPPGGLMFRRAKFGYVDSPPKQVRWRVRYWDKAGTAGGGAFTVGVLMSEGVDGLFYVEDIIRGQWGDVEREQVIQRTAEADGHLVKIWQEQEGGSAGKDVVAIARRALAGYLFEAEKPSGDKETRARAYAIQVNAGGEGELGNVRLVRAPWNRAYLDELELFPRGKFKDQVDASSGAFNRGVLSRKQGGPVSTGGRDRRPTGMLGPGR